MKPELLQAMGTSALCFETLRVGAESGVFVVSVMKGGDLVRIPADKLFETLLVMGKFALAETGVGPAWFPDFIKEVETK